MEYIIVRRDDHGTIYNQKTNIKSRKTDSGI